MGIKAPNKKIFFWDKALLPEDFVRTDVEPLKRLAAAAVLMNGLSVASYRGMAHCRMPKCPVLVGSQDWENVGFLYPSGCEHYILEHGIWIPECDVLIDKGIAELLENLG